MALDGVNVLFDEPTSDVALLHLPNELLIFIFYYLHPKDLYALSIVSRRLHYVALPIYLGHYGIKNAHRLTSSSEVVSISISGSAALRGLRLALFLTSVLSIRFTFTSESTLASELDNLGRLISRLSSIREIILDFGLVRVDQVQKFLNEQDLNQWNVLTLFDRLDGKSCGSFIVTQFDYLSAPNLRPTLYAPSSLQPSRSFPGIPLRERRTKMSSLVAVFRKLVPGGVNKKNDQLSPLGIGYSVPPVISPMTTLKTVEIRSVIPFFPLMCHWTIASLNSSPIVDLTLYRADLHGDAWGELLKRLRMPALSTLTISSSSLPVADLENFLSRHPTITLLKLLSGAICPSSVSQPLGHRLLPRLVSLRATPDYITYLLDGCHGTFPSLRSVSIEPLRLQSENFDFYDLDGAFASLSKHSSLATLSLELPGGSRTADWLSKGQQTKLISLPSITNLELRTYFLTGHIPLSAIKSLPKWLSRFPALQEAAFGRGLLSRDMILEDKVELVRQSSIVCPRLQTVRIVGEEYEVSAWLAMSGR